MTAILPLAAFARRRAPLPRPLSAVQERAWRPGLDGPAQHAEIFASAQDAAGAALALALAFDAAAAGEGRPWLWVQDAAALRQGGRPYRPGLPPALRDRLIHVAAASDRDALFALEEGLRCRDLAFVIGELAGSPRALDFTASRRLSLAAEKHGTPLWLVRLDAPRDLSSARMRWQVHAAPSVPSRWNDHAPGTPAWRAELFRARAHPPGQWILHNNGRSLTATNLSGANPPGRPAVITPAARTPDHGDLAGGPGDRPVAAG